MEKMKIIFIQDYNTQSSSWEDDTLMTMSCGDEHWVYKM